MCALLLRLTRDVELIICLTLTHKIPLIPVLLFLLVHIRLPMLTRVILLFFHVLLYNWLPRFEWFGILLEHLKPHVPRYEYHRPWTLGVVRYTISSICKQQPLNFSIQWALVLRAIILIWNPLRRRAALSRSCAISRANRSNLWNLGPLY